MVLSNSITKYIISSEGMTDRQKWKEMRNNKVNSQEFANVFSGIWCFKCTSRRWHETLQIPLKCVAYVLQEPFKMELEGLQQQQIIIVLIGIDKLTEWCNNSVLMSIPNGTVWLCLNPARLNQVLIRPVHRWPTINNILPRLTSMWYLTLIDVSLCYHNLKLNNKLSYLTIFVCQVGTNMLGYHLAHHQQETYSSER